MGEVSTTLSTALAEATFHIEGMDCPDELDVIERRLRRLAGVGELFPNYVHRTLRVEYDSHQCDAGSIAAAIREVGFQARPEGEAAPAESWWQRRGRMVLLGAAIAQLLAAAGLEAARAYALWEAGVAALLLLAGSTVTGGFHVARSGMAALLRGIVEMNLLMTVAAAGAFILAFRYGELPFEAATVMCLFSLALWLETRSLDRARRAIGTLMELSPQQAVRLDDAGHAQVVAAAEVAVGDRIQVRPGDKIAVDGVVLDGSSSVNESPVTGESVPVEKQPGARVYAGSLNGEGALVVEARRAAAESTLAKIIQLVGQAQASRAPTQQLVDRFARWYTPSIIVTAVLIAVVPPLLSLGGGWDEWIYRGLVLLVIACPCALVISTPVTMVCGLAQAARRGLLIKGGIHLENAGRLRAVIFDKTGTLTAGTMQVEQVVPCDDISPEEVLALAAAVEQRSEHPLALAIVREARRRGLELPHVTGFEAMRGFGARGRRRGEQVYVGSRRMLEQMDSSPQFGPVDAAEVATEVIVATSNRLFGRILLSDRPRPEAAEAVQRLHGLGVARVEMLTGDNRRIAGRIAGELGVDAFEAELMPDEKVESVHRARQRWDYVAMVGDGVNDAPALAAATVGVSMGAAASDTALETADVSLMSDDLRRLADLIQLGRQTRRVIGQNITLSLAIKLVFLVLVLSGPVIMWLAVAADMGASLLVVFNGMRLAVASNHGEREA